MKILTPRMHGYLDYLVVLTFAAAPTLFGFSVIPSRVSYALAVVHLLLTIFTAFPLGLMKLIPFTIHGALELIVSVTLVVLPFALGFAGEPAARNFYIGAGVVIFIVWLTTKLQRLQRTVGDPTTPGWSPGVVARGEHQNPPGVV